MFDDMLAPVMLLVLKNDKEKNIVKICPRIDSIYLLTVHFFNLILI